MSVEHNKRSCFEAAGGHGQLRWHAKGNSFHARSKGIQKRSFVELLENFALQRKNLFGWESKQQQEQQQEQQQQQQQQQQK
jgi:hypothetical protein